MGPSHLNAGVIADLDGDGLADVALGDGRGSEILIHRGLGARAFAAPAAIEILVPATGIHASDADGDGILDLTAASLTRRSVSIACRESGGGFSAAAVHRVGLGPSLHRVMHLDQDGIADILALGYRGAMIRLGERATPPPLPRFRRGDADANGRVEISDPIAVLNRLFRSGAPLPCADAADANDDGRLDLTDPVRALDWLFRGGLELAAPGPAACGSDPTSDELPDSCRGGC